MSLLSYAARISISVHFAKKSFFIYEKFGCYYFLSYLCTRFYGRRVCRAVVGHRSLIGFTWTESSTRSVCRSFRDGRWVKETTWSFFLGA